MYTGILKSKGTQVDDETAFEYALQDILSDVNAKKEFIDWYFSGNWIYENYEEG